MPLYDFKCPSGHTFDALAKPEEPRDCPQCGAPAARQPGTPAFALKGAGWTDKGRRVAGKPA